MAQLHFSVDERTARRLAREAKLRGMSLSKYLASLVTEVVGDRWPDGFLDGVIGSCAADPLEAPDDLPLDDIDL